MLINADFSRRAIVTPEQYRWVASPLPGVERVMLDRVGAEQARATSIVRYAPGSSFSFHLHPGGEEILVLAGTFSDAGGDYPAGWYLRNPPAYGHAPFSHEGATIFVKLRQMQREAQPTVRVDIRDPRAWCDEGGRAVCPLYADEAERVSVQRVSPGDTALADTRGGAELLVLEGAVRAADVRCETGSWIRLPAGDAADLVADTAGATIYLKTGHLLGVG
jgi:anti-sigma factor ChrR (cupin superfamily)